MKKIVDFIVRYKLYHLLFWFIYHYLWWALIIGSAVDAAENILFSNYKIKFTFYVVVQALGVYFNLYVLIPRFLQRGKYLTYGVTLFSTILIAAALITSGYYINAWVADISFEELFFRDPSDYWGMFKTNALPSTAASMTLAMSIKLTKNWLNSEKRRHAIEKEKLQTELKFLRSQLNPHFLFNTINSIFVLIHKNQDMASESLAKFSELLRYQLYQCNEPFISLDKELEYLKNFIELEKLRHNTEQLQMDFEIDSSISTSFSIAPFLLIPFIENAFKHVSHHADQPNWLQMSLLMREGTLIFKIVNSVQALKINQKDQTSGVGLSNVKRRLELMYPNAHQLVINRDEKRFEVDLQLKLTRLETVKLKTA